MTQDIFPAGEVGPAETLESSYFVDIVFALDSTKSMEGIIAAVRDHTRQMVEQIIKAFEQEMRPLQSLRVGVVEFRDLVEDKARQMVKHDFVEVYAKGEDGTESLDYQPFIAILEGIEARGGGDAPESSLDALIHALNYPWHQLDPAKGEKQRKIVVLITDNPPRPIHASTIKEYSLIENLEDSEQVTVAISNALQRNEVRLLIIGPDCEQFQSLRDAPYTNWLQLDPGQAQAGVYQTDSIDPAIDWIVKSSTPK